MDDTMKPLLLHCLSLCHFKSLIWQPNAIPSEYTWLLTLCFLLRQNLFTFLAKASLHLLFDFLGLLKKRKPHMQQSVSSKFCLSSVSHCGQPLPACGLLDLPIATANGIFGRSPEPTSVLFPKSKPCARAGRPLCSIICHQALKHQALTTLVSQQISSPSFQLNPLPRAGRSTPRSIVWVPNLSLQLLQNSSLQLQSQVIFYILFFFPVMFTPVEALMEISCT